MAMRSSMRNVSVSCNLQSKPRRPTPGTDSLAWLKREEARYILLEVLPSLWSERIGFCAENLGLAVGYPRPEGDYLAFSDQNAPRSVSAAASRQPCVSVGHLCIEGHRRRKAQG